LNHFVTGLLLLVALSEAVNTGGIAVGSNGTMAGKLELAAAALAAMKALPSGSW
jgi:hypothetical protein